MKNLLIIISFLLCACPGWSRNYLDYHNYINQAEYDITHHLPDSALYYYDKAFGEFDFIFAKDALIAAQVAWKQNNRGKTIAYLIKGAQSGLRSKCIDECPVLASFTNDPNYEQLYLTMKEANEQFNTKLNADLRDEWENRFSEQVMEISIGEPSGFIDAILKNVARVKALMQLGKYPGECHIGLEDNCELENTTAFFALANYECVISELHDALWEAVKRGELHPREFANLWEWEYVTSIKNMSVLTSNIRDYIIRKEVRLLARENTYMEINRNWKKTAKPMKRFNLLLELHDIPDATIDKNRKEYYICSLETDSLKKQMEQNEGYRFFFGHK